MSAHIEALTGRLWQICAENVDGVLVPAHFTAKYGMLGVTEYRGPVFAHADQAREFIAEHGYELVQYKLIPFQGPVPL